MLFINKDKEWLKACLQNQELVKKLKKIKLIISDIDGCLTDGKVYYSGDEEIQKCFSIQDGYLMAKCNKEGMPHLALISGRSDKAAKKRAKILGIPDELYYQGVDAKRATLNGGLSEASARFNHAYARFILDKKRSPTGVTELHIADYLGADSGTVGTGEDIGDFLVTWRDKEATEPNSIVLYIESAPGIITDWTGLDSARQTVISSITWFS